MSRTEIRPGRRRLLAPLLTLALLCGCGLWATRDPDERIADADSPAPRSMPEPTLEPPVPHGAPSRTALAPATRIEGITIERADAGTRVVVQLDGFVEPEVSLLVNHRLVIDVPGTSSATLPRVLEARADPLVERVRTAEHAAPELASRVVIDLKSRADFAVRAQPDRIVVLLTPGDSTARVASGGASPGEQDERAAGDAPGEQRVLLGAEPARREAAVTGAPQRKEAASTEAAASALPPLDAAHPTPVPAAVEAAVDAAAVASAIGHPGSPTTAPAWVVGDPAPDERASPPPIPDGAASAAERAGTPAPLETPEPVAAVAEPLVEATRGDADPHGATAPSPGAAAARGKRISIDFTETDVRTVIDLIASAGGYRVIFTPDVDGVVSVTMAGRPWEDALDVVLRAKQLREVRHEDLMLVSPEPRDDREADDAPP